MANSGGHPQICSNSFWCSRALKKGKNPTKLNNHNKQQQNQNQKTKKSTLPHPQETKQKIK